MAALAACACLGIAVPLSMTLADFGASYAIAAVSGGAQNLLELLDRRSPGSRTEGQLTKTKHHQRALAKMRGAPHVRAPAAEPVPAGLPELAAILMDVPQPLPVELAAAPLAKVGPPPSLGTLIGSPGGGGGGPLIGSPGGGGGGGGGGPGTPGGDTPQTIPTEQPHVPVVDTPAVPEPGTWAMMLLGFAAIGWRVRRRATGSRLVSA